VEYEDYVSDQVWVKFPVRTIPSGPQARRLEAGQPMPQMRPLLPEGVSVLIWTTTPWTIPGNRAISFSPKISYGLYEVTDAPAGNWAKVGDKFIIAEKLAVEVLRQARVTAFRQIESLATSTIASVACWHPLRRFSPGYEFIVPLLEGDHVSDDTG